MNLYGTYVSHTHLIKSRTPFVKKNPPLPEAAYGPVVCFIIGAEALVNAYTLSVVISE
jgi:hypothetical protein